MEQAGAEDPHAAQLGTHLRWLLIARLLIISCFAGAVIGLRLVSSEERYVFSTAAVMAAVAAIYAVSIASIAALRRVRRLDAFAHAQIAVDLLITTGAVVLTGGPDSPFSFLYSLTIFNGAILLYAPGAAIAAIGAGASYTALSLAIVTGTVLDGAYPLPQHPFDAELITRLLITNASFFVLAYLAAAATQRLRETERLLDDQRSEGERLARLQEALAQHIGCGLVTTDNEGRVTSANYNAAAMVGEEPGAILGRDLGAVFPPLHLSAEGRTAFLQSTSATSATEFGHTSPDGAGLVLRCSATAVRDTYGNSAGVLYIIQDVTLLRQLEQRYQEEGQAALDEAAEIVGDDGEEVAATDGFVGRSPAMQRVRAMIEKVATSDATVLLRGESGTGKELAARAIHARSPRKDRPFVAINCGAIPENLIESELFGHVKGAFTGAVANRPGFFRTADGGTAFLDEIGELPAALQVKLLRVLQERVFTPIGGEVHVAVNVRVVAATNKNLEDEVRAGRFREDLFYRLNVIDLELPPLRDRRDDVPLLIRHYLRMFSELHRKRVTRLSVGAARRLLDHHYPGNVRELANIVEHAVTMSDGETVHEAHLPPHLLEPPRPRARQPEAPAAAETTPDEQPAAPAMNGNGVAFVNLEQHLEDYEKEILSRALRDAGGVKKRAAELLGINYRSFRHRLGKYGLGGDGGELDLGAQS